jgi:hypothetical protein
VLAAVRSVASAAIARSISCCLASICNRLDRVAPIRRPGDWLNITAIPTAAAEMPRKVANRLELFELAGVVQGTGGWLATSVWGSSG